MGLSVDNETLAIAVIVGAAALYYFTHAQQTDEEVAKKRDDDRKGISIRNLAVLERRYDALDLQDVMLSYEEHTKTSLLLILTDTERLQSEAGDITGIDDTFFERTAALIRSCRHYLTAFKELDQDEAEHEERKKGLCATKSVGVTTNVAIVHNNFDQRRQSATSIQAVIDARRIINQQNVDGRSVSFNQQNNELRQLNIRNPHNNRAGNLIAEYAGPQSTGASSNPSLGLLRHNNRAGNMITEYAGPQSTGASSNPSLGLNRPQEVTQLNIHGNPALSHVTNEGSHNQSILDQRQTNTENRIVVAQPVSVCGTHYVSPTSTVTRDASTVSTPSVSFTRSIENVRSQIESITGSKVGSIHEVDVFNTAPPINRDNHDKSPAVAPVPPVGGEELANAAESNPGMFDEGGRSGRKTRRHHASEEPAAKRHRVPPSPSAIREAGVKQRVTAVEMRDLDLQFKNTAGRLNGSTSYQDAIVKQMETIITSLDKSYRGASESDKQIYRDSLRQQMLDRILEHKNKFGVN